LVKVYTIRTFELPKGFSLCRGYLNKAVPLLKRFMHKPMCLNPTLTNTKRSEVKCLAGLQAAIEIKLSFSNNLIEEILK